MSARVSPTDPIHARIDALFAQDRPLPEILVEVARLGAHVLMQAALEAEVSEFLGRDQLFPFRGVHADHRLTGSPASRWRGRHRKALPAQFLGQVPHRLRGPPQRALWVIPLLGLDQRQQRCDQTGSDPLGRAPAPTGAPGPTLRHRSTPASSSATPRRTVVSLTPAARAPARTPPCPNRRASVARASRCCRSFRCGSSTSNRDTSPRDTSPETAIPCRMS